MTNQSKGRGPFLFLAAVFFGPLLAAWIWFFALDPQINSTTNTGVLIKPPVPVSLDPNVDLNSYADEDYLRRKWTIIYSAAANCQNECREDLYTIRQVRASLHRRMERVQGLLLVNNGLPNVNFSEYLKTEHEGLRVENSRNAQRLVQAINKQHPAINNRNVYIVDPLGNLMMYFPPETPPAKMQKDIKRLLKVSRVG